MVYQSAQSRVSQVTGIVGALLLAVLPAAPLLAEPRPSPRGTKRQQRQEALEALPMKELSPEVRAQIAPLIGREGMHRRLSTEVLRCDPHMYEFLVDEPDVTVAIWRALGISRLKLRRLADGQFELQDHKGLEGRIRFIHRSPGQRLIWFEGDYRNPLTGRPIAATVLIQLRSATIREASGIDYVAHRLDAFLKLDSDAAELFLRILEPFTASQANRNFSQIGDFLAVMSAMRARHPQWVLQLADRLESVSPEQRRRLRKLVHEVASHSADSGSNRAERAQPLPPEPRKDGQGGKIGRALLKDPG